MHVLNRLINQYLEKLGIQDFTQLDDDERKVYDQWYEVLNSDVTLADVEKFIDAQLKTLGKELQQAVKDGHDRKAVLITARLDNYQDLKSVIAAPDNNRDALATHIKNLLNHE